jgi:hypothetical protein
MNWSTTDGYEYYLDFNNWKTYKRKIGEYHWKLV